ncbi:hypothetical protein BDW62DRAFT_210154 [Aspergillus aurantiobrunneus]
MPPQREDVSEELALSPAAPPRLKLPRHPEMLALALSSYLKSYNLYPDAPCVHPRPISFPSGQQKLNWESSLPDTKYRDTYSRWLRAAKHEKICWIGSFSMWTRSWVGDPEWDSRPWHVWAAAILRFKNRKGKCMIIYDCDPRIPSGYDETSPQITTRARDFLLRAQFKLVKRLQQKEKIPINALFYSTDTRRSGRDRCLYYTMKWIRKMVRYGDAPFKGFDDSGRSVDPRTTRCALLIYNTVSLGSSA